MAQVAGLQDFRQEGPPGDIGVFQASASVIVYQFTFSGTTYTIAQRMGVRGWVLVSQGAVAATVIQAAINALPNGGKIFIKAGTYTITVQITLGNDIILCGEGRQTILQGGTGLTINVLYLNDMTDVVIQDITLDGSLLTGGQGIYVYWGVNNALINVFVIDFPSNGLYLLGGDHGTTFYADRCYFVGNDVGIWIKRYISFSFKDCVSEANTGNGVTFENGPTGGLQQSGVFTDLWCEQNVYQVYMFGTAGGITFISPHFVICTQEQIYMDPSVENCVVINPSFLLTGAANCVRVEGSNNIFIGGYWDKTLVDIGTSNKFIKIPTYVTENRVPATITALNTSIAFAHGCSYTPSAGDIHPTLTNLPTTPIGDIYVDTIGAVNATLHCTAPPGGATAIFDISIYKTP